MNTNRDRLDDAIDSVAARLTRVDDNDALASQIIKALPERPAWSLHWLMPRLAITAILALAAAAVVLRPFSDRSPTVLRTENARLPVVELRAGASRPIVERSWTDRRTTVERSWNDRRTIVERPSNDRRTLDVPDHERSLEAIEALSSLTLTPVTPRDLPGEGTLIVAPLAIADLPLAPESISPPE